MHYYWECRVCTDAGELNVKNNEELNEPWICPTCQNGGLIFTPVDTVVDTTT